MSNKAVLLTALGMVLLWDIATRQPTYRRHRRLRKGCIRHVVPRNAAQPFLLQRANAENSQTVPETPEEPQKQEREAE